MSLIGPLWTPPHGDELQPEPQPMTLKSGVNYMVILLHCWEPGRLSLCLRPLAFCLQAHQPCQAPFAMGRVGGATSASASWPTDHRSAVRTGQSGEEGGRDDQTSNHQVVGLGAVAMMPGTTLIPPSAVTLASHDPDVSNGYGQTMVALRKHQQVELPTIRR